MRILLDGVVFQNKHQLGIQRCFREILERLGAQNDIAIWNEFSPISPLPANCRALGPDFNHRPRRYHLFARAKRRLLRHRRAAGTSDFDLFCSTYFTHSPYARLPEVLFVYDMIYEQFACALHGGEEVIAQKREMILSARIIIAISQITADEIAAFYPEVAGRIRVVHLGADHLLAAAQHLGAPPAGIPQAPFVLFVGTRNGYKNFQAVLDAMLTPLWPKHVKLAVVGKPLLPGERLLIQRNGLLDRLILAGPVSDADLAHWYRQSVGFLFPSLQEGFGFPSLEAQSCNAPVACSDLPIFHEVCQESAVYFNPRLPESIAASVRELLSPERRQTLLERGTANVRRFSWDRSASETLAAFEEALSPAAAVSAAPPELLATAH